MSYQAMLNTRNALIGNTAISSQVPANDIKVGWPRQLESFPCILISQAGGTDNGFLGYQTGGLRREENVLQIDIFSDASSTETLQIADNIVPVMISSLAASKTGDVNNFDDKLNVYRKVQTYSFTMEHDDY